jgi:thiamine-monophosphate kinase
MSLLDAVEENRVLSNWAEFLPRSPAQIGLIHQADAELLPLGDDRLLALTVDTVAEEIELGLYEDPETAGWIAVMASLSDLAAVGAEPIGLLLSVTLPAQDRDSIQEAVASGVAGACSVVGTFVLGGDTNSGRQLSIACVAAGIVATSSCMTRLGMEAGHLLFATGLLGNGAALAAAKLLHQGEFAEKDWHPRARLKEGEAVRGVASACMDTSDGLIATLDQLARVNDVSIRVSTPLEALLAPSAKQMHHQTGLPPFPFLASNHGEFELIFSLPKDRLSILDRIAAEMDWQPVFVGQAGPGRGLYVENRFVDGAQVRNLLAECGQDMASYAERLCAACA